MSLKSLLAKLLLDIWLDPHLEGKSIPIAPALQFLDELNRHADSRSPESSPTAFQPPKRQRANTAGQSRAGPSGVDGASLDAFEDDCSSAGFSDYGISDREEALGEDPFAPPRYDPNRKVTEVSAPCTLKG
jgi:hypothetical protein